MVGTPKSEGLGQKWGRFGSKWRDLTAKLEFLAPEFGVLDPKLRDFAPNWGLGLKIGGFGPKVVNICVRMEGFDRKFGGFNPKMVIFGSRICGLKSKIAAFCPKLLKVYTKIVLFCPKMSGLDPKLEVLRQKVAIWTPNLSVLARKFIFFFCLKCPFFTPKRFQTQTGLFSPQNGHFSPIIRVPKTPISHLKTSCPFFIFRRPKTTLFHPKTLWALMDI